MAKSCIICGQSAGSKEHVFPAAFGGRRVNKGIYCEKHNNELGKHVSELLKVLSYFNSSLGVRSDRRDVPKWHVMSDTSGNQYEVLKGEVRLAPPPPLENKPDSLGEPVSLKFASPEQRDAWLLEQDARGYGLSIIDSSDFQKQFLTMPLEERFTFGSEPYRAAMAYLALTYFAQFYPQAARQDILDELKAALLNDADMDDRVWWVDPSSLSSLFETDFPRVHSVILSTNKSGSATAVVVLFGQLCMAVDLGYFSGMQDETVVVDINPLAEKAGEDHDISIRRVDYSYSVGTPAEGDAYISGLKGGLIQNPVEAILRAHEEGQIRAVVAEHLDDLLEVSAEEQSVRLEAVNRFVDGQAQRILNRIRRLIPEILGGMPVPKEVSTQLLGSLGEDPDGPFGLTEEALESLVLAKEGFAREIDAYLVEGALTSESLFELLLGGKGAAAMLRPIIDKASEVLEPGR